MPRNKKTSNIFKALSEPSVQAPGINSRGEPATGLLIRSIKVNDSYLLVESCDIYPRQEIDVKYYIQGGPRSAIADIGKKWVEGQIVFPLSVDRNGNLINSIKDIIKNAEKPINSLKIDTNHVLSHLAITAENGGFDNNELVSLDDLIVKQLKITASPERNVSVSCSFYGTILTRVANDYVNPQDIPISRKITWADCDASRNTSQMRTISNMEFTIENTVQDTIFLTDYTTGIRNDQVSFFGIKQTKLEGYFEEFLRLGMETSNFAHGGWVVNENIVFDFGAVKILTRVPLFQKSEQPVNSKLIIRKTKFLSMTSPDLNSPQGKFIYFAEDTL